MSDTPKAGDPDIQRLLDNGWSIHLYRNALGSYTARARRWDEKVITDDFLPSQALFRLVEKVHCRIV
jgi:hypothetical protein